MVALGAHEIAIGGAGELGPLDVQLRKPDEILESESGLDILQALVHLMDVSLEAFRTTLLDITTGAGLSTKASADIATNLIIGLYGNIFSQIDPVRLGAVVRANRVGMHYGAEIGENLKAGALVHLVNGYPSHGCVIDRTEAEKLFCNVRNFTDAESRLLKIIGRLLDKPEIGRESPRVTSLEAPHDRSKDNSAVERPDEDSTTPAESKPSATTKGTGNGASEKDTQHTPPG